jgi:hypothetical protein
MTDKPKGFDESTPFQRTFIKPSTRQQWPCPAMLRNINKEFGKFGSTDNVLYRPVAESDPSFTDTADNLRRLFADLADKYRHEVREVEADIVLSAVELYGVDIRQLHQQIHPDRTVYLVAGEPLVAVWRPSLINGETLTPHRWMDVEPGPLRFGMKYKLLYTPETKN